MDILVFHKRGISMLLRKATYKQPPIYSGSDNPNWKGGKAVCLDCGKELSQRKYKRCLSCSRKGPLNVHYKKEGSACSNWKGGVTKLYANIRNLFEYRQWKSDVFTRDGFECASCCSKTDITAHHMTSFYQIVKEENVRSVSDAITCSKLWDINNGITLCYECHKKIHDAIGWKININSNINN